MFSSHQMMRRSQVGRHILYRWKGYTTFLTIFVYRCWTCCKMCKYVSISNYVIQLVVTICLSCTVSDILIKLFVSRKWRHSVFFDRGRCRWFIFTVSDGGTLTLYECFTVMLVRQFSRDRGRIYEAEARQLRIRSRRGKAEARCSRSRRDRGRMLEAEARQSENHVNDDTRNFDNILNSWRNTHSLHLKTLLYR